MFRIGPAPTQEELRKFLREHPATISGQAAPPPAPQPNHHQTTPGRMTFTVLERD